MPDPEGIDVANVTAWLAESLPGLRPPLRFELIAGGHSNLTYVVTDATGSCFVLRRPPVGELAATAHDMAREHTILAALAGTGVPVAPVHGLCTDPAVTGAPFFVMSHVDGVVLRDRATAEPYPAVWRRAAAADLVRTLARVHDLDVDDVGLGELGRHDGYVARQLARWHQQFGRTRTATELPLVDELHAALASGVPAQSRVSLVHGDYRFENCVLAADGSAAAVLDWELTTLGEPLADLGLLLIYWTLPDETEPIFPDAPTATGGFGGRDWLRDTYAAARDGADTSRLDWFVAFGYWKLACISAGVLDRYRERGSEGYAGLSTQAYRCATAAAAALDRA